MKKPGNLQNLALEWMIKALHRHGSIKFTRCNRYCIASCIVCDTEPQNIDVEHNIEQTVGETPFHHFFYRDTELYPDPVNVVVCKYCVWYMAQSPSIEVVISDEYIKITACYSHVRQHTVKKAQETQ